MIPRQASQAGIDLIKSFEGLRLVSYQDDGGVWTVGYGSTSGVCAGLVITQAQAEARLAADVAIASSCVDRKCGQLTQNQFDALTSFAFNIGTAAFCGSTLLHLLNAGDTDAAALQFVRWDRVGTAVSGGLLTRRERERALFLTP